MPQFAIPEGYTEDHLVPRGGLRGAWTGASRAASPRTARSRPSTRWTSSSRWASRATSSWSPTSSCGRRTTASRSAPAVAPRPARSSRTRMGITDLDPIPHGLIFERFLNPERVSMPDVDIDFDERRRGRGDPVRDREVRRRQGRHDRHLRHDQGQGRDQGLRPRARLPVRDGRPDHQGDARRRDGQGHPADRHLRPDAPPLQRGRRDPRRCTRTSRTSRRSSTPRKRHRGPDPADGRARRRRDHVQRAASPTTSRSGRGTPTA